jgi:hypothetical protein
MAKRITYGKVDILSEDFKDENITAHISIRLPLNLLKDLKKLALTDQYQGRYQTLIRDILTEYAREGLRSESLKTSKKQA